MVKFIGLNQACGNDAFKELIINAAHIQHVVIGNKGKDVHIRMSDGTFFFVRESLAEIKRLIGSELVSKPSVREQMKSYIFDRSQTYEVSKGL